MIEPSEIDTVSLTKEQYSVYSCICYFHIFKYPVKEEEILEYCHAKLSCEQIQSALSELTALELIYKVDEYFCAIPEYRENINKRRDSEKRFNHKTRIISRYARFISRFPYVEGVAISGSCSKGLLDAEGDVDYFVITSPGKLWLCRTMLILFKKVFLFNSKKYFCLNYFVDSESLEIPDKNIFVANEIKTLTPISNKPLFERFFEVNSWTNNFLPNKEQYNSKFLETNIPNKYIFRLVEILLDNQLGEMIDKWCFEFTFSNWKRKFSKSERSSFELNFRSKRNVSKHHPRGFQNHVLVELERTLDRVKVTA